MPAWTRILSDTEIRDVVQYIKGLSPQFASPPRTVTVGPGLPSSPDSIARGHLAYDKLQCGKCHGSDGRGTGAVNWLVDGVSNVDVGSNITLLSTPRRRGASAGSRPRSRRTCTTRHG